ncbi:MAG: helix-turn-helix transcriptional regulator [Flavobacteriales bacterium]
MYEAGIECVNRTVLSEFGNGYIHELNFNCITILISSIVLNSDIVIYDKNDVDRLQLSFLLEGEKIISFENKIDDILYESQESYMAFIKDYEGFYRITGNKPFREVKIKLSKEFLIQHGLDDGFEYKKITDPNLIITIPNDLLSILSDLELKSIKGIARKILLEAKVLEILAIQIDNYKNNTLKNINVKSDKSLKTIYNVKDFLKNNLEHNYYINQLSNEFGLNENVLKSKFKKIFNVTIHQFYMDEKMKKSKELLRITQLPIYEIAEEVGYKNATHFSAAFKRYYKESPNKFRKKL